MHIKQACKRTSPRRKKSNINGTLDVENYERALFNGKLDICERFGWKNEIKVKAETRMPYLVDVGIAIFMDKIKRTAGASLRKSSAIKFYSGLVELSK